MKLLLMKYTCVLILVTIAVNLFSQNTPQLGDRFAFTTISAIPPDDDSFGGGYSIYSSVWPFYETYPRTELFQTGLVSVWMTPQPTGNEPAEFYNTIEGGLGWWTGLRFGHTAPKFIMGGVSNGFFSWANGPGTGQAEEENGFRDWSQPHGMLEVAQLSNNLLWPPDGLNLSVDNKGELLGYGYVPLPLTEEITNTSGTNIHTGDQSWTLFLNSENFKGPVAFFLPTFWTKPALENPALEGLFLDTRPSEPVSSYGFETATLPAVHSVDDNGNLYFKVMPNRYPISTNNESILLNRPMVYSRAAMWDEMQSWFDGGPVAPTNFAQTGQLEILFDVQDSDGTAFFESRIKVEPGGDSEDDEYAIETNYITPFVKDAHSWGYKMDLNTVEIDNTLFKTPTYFETDNNTMEGEPISESQVPSESGLIPYEFETNTHSPQPYLTPLETDCPWYDPDGVWLNPGPVSGPFQESVEDGSTLTYYWYKFIDQPAVLEANLTDPHRQMLQERIELIHSHWQSDDQYLPNPTAGNLASLDDALKVIPPAGLEVGYVPIVTRQEKATILSIGKNVQEDLISIHPNPTKSALRLSEMAQSVVIYSVSGNRIKSVSSTDTINTESLSSGIYFFRIQLQNGFVVTKKVIKK